MKAVLIPALLAVCLTISGYGQPTVVLDSLDGTLVCGKLSQSEDPYTQYVAIANPDAEQKEIRITLAFSIDAGQTLQNFQVQYLNGIETAFGVYGGVTSSIEQQGTTTIVTLRGINQIPSEPGGLPISADPITYFGISFELGWERYYGAESLSIDSTASPTHGDWYFSHATAPAFSGPVSWPIYRTLPDCGPYFADFPDLPLQANPCSPLQYTLSGVECNPGATLIFRLHTAPEGATIDSLTGFFKWQPGPEHVGQQFEITVALGEDICPGSGESYIPSWFSRSFTVSVSDCNPPQFIPGQSATFVITTDQDFSVQYDVTDPDPVNHHTFSYYVSSEDPWPPCDFDTLTGAFHYTGTPADTNVYYVYVVVHDGPYADTTGFWLYHFDTYICGDINHFGGILVSDLTWFISYMFRGGPPPVTTLAGDLDCSGDIKIPDLTYLIAYLFRGGPAPCAACPR